MLNVFHRRLAGLTTRTAMRAPARLSTGLLSVLMLVALPAAARAATLQLRDTGASTGLTVRGDGERYIAWVPHPLTPPPSNQDVRVLDTQTGKTRVVTLPPGCFFADIHHGTILSSCPPRSSSSDTGRTLDLVTGQAAELPAYTSQASVPDGARYEAVGDRWARVRVYGYHYSFAAYVNRNTGLFVTPQDRLNLLADVDRMPLTRKLCQGQQRPTVPDTDFLGVEPGPLAVASTWTAATSYKDQVGRLPGRVLLQHCGRAPLTVAQCRHVECTQPVITDRWIAWAENRGTSGRVVVRSLATGRTRRTTFRAGAQMTPLLVGKRLYATSGERLLQASL